MMEARLDLDWIRSQGGENGYGYYGYGQTTAGKLAARLPASTCTWTAFCVHGWIIAQPSVSEQKGKS